MIFSGRVENARGIERVLGRLGDDLERRGALDAVLAALEPALADLRRNTPVDTGALRRSAAVTVARERGSVAALLGWSANGRVRRQQMVAVEFGGRGRRGRRALSRSFDEDRAERDLARELGVEIDAALARGVARSGGKLRLS